MANKEVADLTFTGSVTGSEYFHVQGSDAERATLSAITALGPEVEASELVLAPPGVASVLYRQPYVRQWSALRNDGFLGFFQEPVAGNTLLYISGGWDVSLGSYVPAGFTLVNGFTNGSNNGVRAYYRIWEPGDPFNWDVSAGDNQFCALYEISNCGSVGAMLYGTGEGLRGDDTYPGFNVLLPEGINEPDLKFYALTTDGSHINIPEQPGVHIDTRGNTNGNHEGMIMRYTGAGDYRITGTLDGTAGGVAMTVSARGSLTAVEPQGARYWRILVNDVNNETDVVGIARLEMYWKRWGYNVIGGGTPIGNSDGGYLPGRAFDNAIDADSTWAKIGGLGTDAWIGYDFGEGQVRNIKEIGIYNASTNNSQPVSFTVQSSDDGVVWNNAWSVTGADWTGKRWQRFTNPDQPDSEYTNSPHGGHNRWRVQVARNGFSALSAAEVIFKQEPEGPSASTGGTASADSSYGGGYEPSKAFDGNNATLWAGAGATGWIAYKFMFRAKIAEVLWRSRQDSPGYGDQSMRDGLIQYSDWESGVWTTAWEVYNLSSWGDGETRIFTDPAYLGEPYVPPAVDRYWRTTHHTGAYDANVSIGGMEFFQDQEGTAIPYTVSSNGDYPGRPVTNLTDGDATTIWTPTGTPKMMTAYLATLTEVITRIDIQTADIGGSWYVDQGLKTFNVDSSVDGLDWIRYATGVTVPDFSSAGQVQEIDIFPDSKHRYWRFRNSEAGFNYSMLNTMQVYDATGAVDYMTTATVTSTAPQDGSIANLSDGNSNSYCQFTPEQFFIKLDLGSPIELTKWVIGGGGAGGYLERAPTVFFIEWSDDNINWNLHLVGVPDGKWVSYTTPLTFETPTSRKTQYAGILVTATQNENNNRGQLSIAEITFNGESPTAAHGTGAFNGSVLMSYVCDGNPSTIFSSGKNSGWFAVAGTLSSPTYVNEVAVTTRNDTLGTDDAPTTGIVLFSQDEITFRPSWNFTFPTWVTDGQSQTVSKP